MTPSSASAQNTSAATGEPDLRLLYDGGCPLCCREVAFLRQRDQRLHPDRERLAFIDINKPDYDPAAHADVSYRQAMGRIHAIAADGEVLTDLAVFRHAYRIVGLGPLYAPTGWPVLGAIATGLYALWARWRLRITGRADLDTLCAERCRLPG
jgi:predicted DCC family thiol-disulfide oxidoreductase YuxK